MIRIPVRYWPVKSRILSKSLQRRSMDDICLSRTMICPEETAQMPPVAMPREHRVLVTTSQLETTLDHEWNRIAGYEAQHKATERYTFSNVLATPYGFFVDRHGFNQLDHPSLGALKSAQIHKADMGFFGLSTASIKYFGHWMLDGLPATLLRQPGEELYFPVNQSWRHANSYLDLLEIDRLKHDFVLFETMSFCVDIGQNSNRRSRTKSIQDTLRSKTPNGNKRVYISRGHTGANRLLTNEAELVAALEGVGFVTVPVTAPLEDILAACTGADVSVSIEGSHMSHVFFLSSPGAFHVTINPVDRFNNVYADYMPSLDMRLGTFVAKVDDDGYRVDVPGLLEFLTENMAIAL